MTCTIRRKGQAPNAMLYLVLFIVVLAIVLLIIKNYVVSPLKGFTSEELKMQTRYCVSEVQNAQQNGVTNYVDWDISPPDGCLDSLDPCLGGDMADSDIDGLPDACDADPNDPTVVKCRQYIAESDKMQCCTEEYTRLDQSRPGIIRCRRAGGIIG